jgi:hypothetical protein
MQIGLSLSLTAQLRSSITYAVLGYDPALVFDFKNSYYRKVGASTTFGASITHAASTNATMVDSDGLLKWRTHNLLTHSGDLNNANWTNNALTVTTGQNDFEGNPTAFKVTPTTVSGFHRLYKSQGNSNLVLNLLSTVTIDLKADGYNFFSIATSNQRYAIINLSDGTVSLNTGSISPTVTSLGNGWYRCSVTTPIASQEVFSVGETAQSAAFGSQTFTGDGTSGVLVAYPHSFRSDLGGMVNNPDTASSYVPTTTAAVYLSRRGHHIYNGSAWVNEGILHESEARTNLYLNSNQFVSPWTLIGSTVTASAGTSPSGLADAWRWVGDGTSILYQGTPYVVGDYTVSAWVKSNGAGEDTFRFYGANSATSGNFTATSEWVRYSFAFTSASAVNQFSGISYGSSQGNVDLLVYGFQIEAGATPSSYIPTTSATVTRAAETLTVPAANLPYDNTNMSIQIDGKMTYADNGSEFSVGQYRWQSSNTNYIQARVRTHGTRTGQPFFAQRQPTSGYDEVLGGNTVYSPDTNVPFNLASRHGSTFINGANEGTLLTVNTTPTILPDLSSTDLDLGFDFMGTIGQFRMWSDDLGDVGITEAST